VPSPGADPVPEQSPNPPRTQASSAFAGHAAQAAARESNAYASTQARSESARIQALLADLMSARKELTERSAELRRVVTERNALRTRLLRADSKARELSSAFRAEAQLRSEFVDAHAASSASLRARVAELEAELISLPELDLKLVELEAKLRERDEQIRELTEQVTRADSKPPGERVGLRRIRGIGPAYERALLALGITTVTQIAQFTPEEITRLAPLIKARADRILRDDWVGQARLLSDD
jgi:predicted flap endonuclease-1-like 5' DNA nuclease